jgi:pyruvate,water dikinase
MVRYLIQSDKISKIDLVGGKGQQLQKLKNWGAEVAPFVILPTTLYEKVQAQSYLPQELIEEVEEFIQKNGKVVLRSSMVGEDQLDASFAGLFETFLDLDVLNWQEALLKIYDSVKSKRVLEYIEQKNIKTSLKMAIVLQKEIQVTKSGVLFTRNPVVPTSLVAIDAAFGMGEGVVSGHADVEHLLLNRMGSLHSRIGHYVLNETEIGQLLSEALRLEKKFKGPADIEWGISEEKLYIFQIRPITRTFRPLGVYADTNLSESYPGIVSPLTAKFVQKAYENVFLESAEHLGMRAERKEKIKTHTQHLIAHIDAHLYYNLEHYYAALRASPGGDKNIHNWHKMIGGKVEGMDIPYHDTKGSLFDNFITAFHFLKIALLRKKIFPDLLGSFELLGKKIEADKNKLKSSSEIIFYLNELLERKMNFGLTIINDFFIMIGLSFLERTIKKKGLSESLLVDILKTENSLESVKPLAAFNYLISDLSAEFLNNFIQLEIKNNIDPYTEIFQKLSIAGFDKDIQKLKNFISEYGDRSFEELKLESLPIKNDPVLLQQLIKWTRGQSVPHLDGGLKGLKKSDLKFSMIEKWFLMFTRECIEYRESSRLWRGRFYHYYRELIIKLAAQLMAEDQSFKKFNLTDFFSLNHEEWLSFAQGYLSREEVEELIKNRDWKKRETTYPEFLIWSEGEDFFHHDSRQVSHTNNVQGLGVSPGESLGVALVLEKPQDIFNFDVKNFILVTKNTDPAWVYIMSQSRGLISEKGSMLSHTAIIGRELSLPTIVGVKNATTLLKTGDQLKINGSTGEIQIL